MDDISIYVLCTARHILCTAISCPKFWFPIHMLIKRCRLQKCKFCFNRRQQYFMPSFAPKQQQYAKAVPKLANNLNKITHTKFPSQLRFHWEHLLAGSSWRGALPYSRHHLFRVVFKLITYNFRRGLTDDKQTFGTFP